MTKGICQFFHFFGFTSISAAKPPVGKHLFFGNKDLTEAQLSQLTDGENQQELLKTFLKLDERYPGVDEANTRRKDVFLAYASHLLT